MRIYICKNSISRFSQRASWYILYHAKGAPFGVPDCYLFQQATIWPSPRSVSSGRSAAQRSVA